MGTSHYGNRVAEAALREAGLDATAIVTSELLNSLDIPRRRTLILVSQSGESGEIAAYLDRQKEATNEYGLTLAPGSRLARARRCMVAPGGAERAFASTRSFFLQIAGLSAICRALGADVGEPLIAIQEPKVADYQPALEHLAGIKRFVLSGRGMLQGVAEAASLNLMELARVPVLAQEGGQLRHGPMEILGEKVGVILIRADDAFAGRVASLAAEVVAAGSPVVVIDASGGEPIAGRGDAGGAARRRVRRRARPAADAAEAGDRPGEPARRKCRRAGALHQGDARPMSPRPVVVGNLNVDMIMGPLPPWPQHGTECLLPDYELRVGGSAGNAALAFHGLGLQPFLVSNVGSDLFADWLEAGMPMDKAIFREATPTTVSVGITHPNGERTFLTNSGHIGALAPDFVSEALARFVEPGAPVLFCGAFLTTLLADAYEEVFALIRAKGGTVAVDTGWPPSGWDSSEPRRPPPLGGPGGPPPAERSRDSGADRSGQHRRSGGADAALAPAGRHPGGKTRRGRRGGLARRRDGVMAGAAGGGRRHDRRRRRVQCGLSRLRAAGRQPGGSRARRRGDRQHRHLDAPAPLRIPGVTGNTPPCCRDAGRDRNFG